MVRFSCCHCGQNLKAHEEMGGLTMKCGSCWQQASIPGVDQTAEYDSFQLAAAEPEDSGQRAATFVLAALTGTILALGIYLVRRVQG
jgi:hypothetical protein